MTETPSYRMRARAESFGAVAAAYDRYRPSYPDALIADLAALEPRTVLDVGCGTGKAARLLAERGADVLGVEIDPAMAAVARSHGVPVEVGAFESWDPGGRTFDLITCGQAWHWVDPVAAVPKAADLLRPGGGTLALFWNYDEPEESSRRALDRVYERFAPQLSRSIVMGGSRQDEQEHAARLRASGRFARVETRTYRWRRVYTAREWAGLVGTHSDHLQLPPGQRAELTAALCETIEAGGGRISSNYGTYAVLARADG